MVLIYWTLVLAAAVGYGTLAVGWWAIPVVALVGAAMAPRRSMPLLSVPLGCVLGWGALLLRSARASAFPELVDALARVLPVSPGVLLAATFLLAMLLAVGASLLGVALRRDRA